MCSVFHNKTVNHEPVELVRCVERARGICRWRDMRTHPNASKRELFKVCTDLGTHTAGYWVSGLKSRPLTHAAPVRKVFLFIAKIWRLNVWFYSCNGVRLTKRENWGLLKCVWFHALVYFTKKDVTMWYTSYMSKQKASKIINNVLCINDIINTIMAMQSKTMFV